MTKTHWKKTMNPNYLGAFAFDMGKDKICTIDHVVPAESVTNPDGETREKPVIHWKENELPWILNVTNCKTIAKLAGSNYFEDWAGLRIQLYVDNKVKAFGTTTEGVRVRKTLPEEAKIACEVCGQFIQPAFNMSASQLAAYTKKKYGKSMCAECAKDQKEAESNGTDK